MNLILKYFIPHVNLLINKYEKNTSWTITRKW